MNLTSNSSYYRNFVFGVEDSLVSTVGLLSGIAVAGVTGQAILATGTILIFVEAISMGAGSFLSESSAETYERHRDDITKRPYWDALIMFISYLISGFIPLFPYVILPAKAAFWTSIGLSLFVLLLLGLFGARVSKTSPWRNMARMVLVGGCAIAIGSIVGRLF